MKGRKFINLVFLVALVQVVNCSKKVIQIDLNVDEQNKKVEVFADGQLFTAYIYPDNVKKPVLWPLVSPKGNILTRSYPMLNKEGDRTDHPHHVGIWFNYGDVNGLDFWNNSEARPKEDSHLYGNIQHVSVEKAVGGEGSGNLSTRSLWLSPVGETLLNEKSSFNFYAKDQLRIIDRSTTLVSMVDTVLFRDNKEGLFAIRVARELELPSQGVTQLIDSHGNITEVENSENSLVKGNYRSSDGLTGEKVWGTRSKWMKLSSEINGEPVSVVIIDHPSNPGYPTYWHARGYGLFSANNLGQSVFSKGVNELNFQLAKGESVEFKHRLVVVTGECSDQMINQLADQFSLL